MSELLADEDFDARVVAFLRRYGHVIETVQGLGLGNRHTADSSVLAQAVQRRLIVITANRYDFIRLHRNGGGHAGVLACTRNIGPEALADRIHAIVPAQDMANRCIKIRVDQDEEIPRREIS